MWVITDGAPYIPGDTVYEKMTWLKQNDDGLRKLLLREPRGHPAHSCDLVVPQSTRMPVPAATSWNRSDTPVMSGGNTIAVVTTLLQTGMAPATELVTELTLKAPAGLIKVRAEVENGTVTSVTFRNVPASAAHLDVPTSIR